MPSIEKMKKLLMLFLFLFVSFQGFSDTLDYWHVYYNDSVIAKYNAASKDLNVKFDLNKIKIDDSLTFRYWDDTPCPNCTYVLIVRDERKKRLKEVETSEFFGKLSFSLPELIELKKKNKSKRLDFYFYEKSRDGTKGDMNLVLQMTVN